MRTRIGGHIWTIAPELRDRVRPLRAPASEPWTMLVQDERLGAIRLGGRLRHEPRADTLLLVVHGLGGSSESPYARRAAAAASAMGWSCLRIDLRGADGSGEDFYHAGLVEDLRAVLGHASLDAYANVVVLGYSLGGHVTLRLGLHEDPRVRAVAAVCAPLDLSRSATAFDRTRVWVYRTHVLRSLKAMYRVVAARRGFEDVDRVMRVTRIREWDDVVVAPRHGFADAEDYYAKASVGPRLGELVLPSLWIGARWDPMVPASTVEPVLSDRLPLEVRWLERGGHVGFPGDVFAEGSVEAAALSWLGRAW